MTASGSAAIAPDWTAVRALFERLRPLSEAQRAAALDDGSLEPALREEVRSLLAHDEASTAGFLGQAAADSGAMTLPAATAPTPAPQRIGQRLGAWRITRPLGSGGMGEVFEARRDDGRFHSLAAIKLLKRGMDSQAVLARFALEQQALARLTHPHIARLLDAGVTEDGLPYFVMERVSGRPIDQACSGLPLRRRLAMFQALADAVSHAHRNLLVHRDLKPSNVLVDDEGRVKLLDFGIAKALDPLEGVAGAEGLAAAATALGERPFTPQYASPEQVRGEPVSTATDVYSLGVLLYLMLTGLRPYGREARTANDIVRSVLEEEPTRASALAAQAVGDLRLASQLRGDLDNILRKALAKAPAERYASVDALAADVQAHLEGRPVGARAASPGYVFAKWLRRHRAAALAASLGGLGLITGLAAALLQGRIALALGGLGLGAGLVLALLQARRAQLARDEAARAHDDATRHLVELRQLANRLVFEVNDALERGLTEGRRQLVHVATQSLERQAGFGQLDDDERLALAQALSRLARLEGHEFTSNLGNTSGALALYERALQMLEPMAPRRQQQAAWHDAMAVALEGRAAAMGTMRQAEEALASMRRMAEHASRAAQLAPEDPGFRAHECSALVQVSDHEYPVVRIHGLTHLAQSRVHAEQALKSSEHFVAFAPTQARAWRQRAHVLRLHAAHTAIAGRLDEAVSHELTALQALEQAAALPGGDLFWATDFAISGIRLAITRRAAGQDEAAAADIERTRLHAEQRLAANPGDEHAQRLYIATVQTALDIALHGGAEAGMAVVYENALSKLPPPEAGGTSRRPWQHAWMDSLQAVAWVHTGQLERAEAVLQRAGQWLADGTLKLREYPSALDHELEANLAIARAHLGAATRRWPEACRAVDEACASLEAMQAVRDPTDAVEPVRAGQLLVRLGRGLPAVHDDEAFEAARRALIERACRFEASLVERGILTAHARRESRWLAEATAPVEPALRP